MLSPVLGYGLRYDELAWACNLFLISFLNVSGLIVRRFLFFVVVFFFILGFVYIPRDIVAETA